MSRTTSFKSTTPFWTTLLEEQPDRLMISAARVPSFTILMAAARASSRFGVSAASQRIQVLALVMAAAIGDSLRVSEAVSSPMVVTRFTCARSACA